MIITPTAPPNAPDTLAAYSYGHVTAIGAAPYTSQIIVSVPPIIGASALLRASLVADLEVTAGALAGGVGMFAWANINVVLSRVGSALVAVNAANLVSGGFGNGAITTVNSPADVDEALPILVANNTNPTIAYSFDAPVSGLPIQFRLRAGCAGTGGQVDAGTLTWTIRAALETRPLDALGPSGGWPRAFSLVVAQP